MANEKEQDEDALESQDIEDEDEEIEKMLEELEEEELEEEELEEEELVETQPEIKTDLEKDIDKKLIYFSCQKQNKIFMLISSKF